MGAARDVRPPADHIRFAAAVQFCSDQAEKTGYDFWHSRSEAILSDTREGAMTTAAEAFLLIGGTLCLSFAAIYVFWFAERLRSNFLGKP